MTSNQTVNKSRELNEQNMLYRLEHRNALPETTAVSINANPSCQQYCYRQLADRVRELEKKIKPPDVQTYSPCSTGSGSGISNFSMNLISPNSSVPAQRLGLSSKILE